MNRSRSFDSTDGGFAWFETFANLERTGRFSERNYKLDRMRELAALSGNPERSFKSIHIAGSKGKGSTAALTAAVLDALGLRTGVYTSPHLQDYRERICRPGGFYDDGLLLQSMLEVRRSVERRGMPQDPPTTFELLTLCAFFVFRASQSEWAVLETGLGGRLDSTNIVNPEACILTPIELEHTDVLGFTLKDIALEKAGIIKPGVPVFMGYQKPEVEEVFRKRARECGAPLYSLAEELVELSTETSLTGTRLSAVWRSGKKLDCRLRLAGRHQGENACLARLCLDTLSKTGVLPRITPRHFAAGLGRARLPGRFEITDSDPPLILDTAHTPASVERTVRTLDEITSVPGVLIFGAVSGKDIRGMAGILAPAFSHILVSRPGSFKPSNPEEVARIFRKHHPRVDLVTDPRSALEKARRVSGGFRPILVTGSFYMAAEIRKLL